ncbi:MAG: HD domain-containing protein [Sphingomonadales bacterium]|nr:HD domain-containing protein [Sphingomonadales bacterium]PIX67173.1 MAG: metal-dependent phosphohydrolase [Sphingomonadales bacterium CG_4_10_14_3_um_filter_58_15]NCO50099.1 HD domain-containing protein [Sphingomonadales bacterium]NCO99534.1 HD domain-containing protein [Sphingomonadales bacterium]NCP27662.1 HD domain-containing protein [Sphingomonadales bacterium]
MYQTRYADFDQDDGPVKSRLSEILGAFSYALDLTEGQPAGHSIRACWIGTQIGMASGMKGDALRDVYYAVLLKDLGCSSNAARVSKMFVGDDRKLKHDFKLLGPEPEDFGAFIGSAVGVDADPETRNQALANLAENVGEIMTDIMATRCSRGADIARRLQLSEDVAQAIAHLDEHWDGGGLPLGIVGSDIHVGGRIALLAQVVDVFFMARGKDAAIAEVRNRSGTWFDPDLCALFEKLSAASGFWEELTLDDLPEQLWALDPATQYIAVDEDYLDDICFAFGHVIDAKSPDTAGHSARVGMIADKIAQKLGMGVDSRRVLRRAAILHDVGKLGVSSAILEKPGKLDAKEWESMRAHATLTTNILGQIGVMSEMAMIAGSHHERLDGKGYPLGLDETSISIESRIITVADIYDALTADRPYRSAMSSEKAMGILHGELGVAIDRQCFAALQEVVEEGLPA